MNVPTMAPAERYPSRNSRATVSLLIMGNDVRRWSMHASIVHANKEADVKRCPKVDFNAIAQQVTQDIDAKQTSTIASHIDVWITGHVSIRSMSIHVNVHLYSPVSLIGLGSKTSREFLLDRQILRESTGVVCGEDESLREQWTLCNNKW